jgi:hypothetical protein
MNRQQHHTFRSKAQREQDDALKSQYRELGNPELVAAISQQKKPAAAPTEILTTQDKAERD